MPVTKTFWPDPYLRELETNVNEVNGPIVTLRETIAFAFSGGQESDQGTIGAYPILQAEKRDLEIYYTLPADHFLQPGDQVLIRINWERRNRLMRLHMAAELVLELMNQLYDHPRKIGAHISEDKARIDFLWSGNISETFPTLNEHLVQLIEANHPIVSEFSDATAEERYWEIKGFARVPCGGTHLKSTGEIGHLALKRKNIGGGKERIEIQLAR